MTETTRRVTVVLNGAKDEVLNNANSPEIKEGGVLSVFAEGRQHIYAQGTWWKAIMEKVPKEPEPNPGGLQEL